MKKLDKEDLDKLNNLKISYQTTQQRVTELTLRLAALERDIEEIRAEQNRSLDEWFHLQRVEFDTIQKLREKYGEGEIDLEHGTFNAE
jgi:DNA-binding protein H-NS